MAPAPKTALTSPAAASGRKRKAPEATSSSEIPVEIKDAGRKYDLDADILECPICLEPFCPPVYQCQSGHSVCSACHGKLLQCPSCSQPIGSFIRNILAEKIVESLKSSCPYAHYGCNEMLKSSKVEEHIKKLCRFRPCPCPVSGCIHEGPKQTLALHLQREHHVQPSTKHMFSGVGDHIATWRFGLESLEQFVILKDHNQNDKPKLLLHREVIEGLGNILFCTCLEDHNITYDLKVLVLQDVYGDVYKPYTTINSVVAVDIRLKKDWKKKDILLCSDREKLMGRVSLLEICIPGGRL